MKRVSKHPEIDQFIQEAVSLRTESYPYTFEDEGYDGFLAVFTVPLVPLKGDEVLKNVKYTVIGYVKEVETTHGLIPLISVDFMNSVTNMEPLKSTFTTGMKVTSTVVHIVYEYLDKYEPEGLIFVPAHRRLYVYYRHLMKGIEEITRKYKYTKRDSDFANVSFGNIVPFILLHRDNL